MNGIIKWANFGKQMLDFFKDRLGETFPFTLACTFQLETIVALNLLPKMVKSAISP